MENSFGQGEAFLDREENRLSIANVLPITEHWAVDTIINSSINILAKFFFIEFDLL